MRKAKTKDCKAFDRKLQRLEQLDLSRSSISDLSPLAALTSLQILNLRSNDISDLEPLSGMSKLRKVDVSNNDISDLAPIVQFQRSIESAGNPRLEEVIAERVTREQDYVNAEAAPRPTLANWSLWLLVIGTVYTVLVLSYCFVIPKWISKAQETDENLSDFARNPYDEAIEAANNNYEIWLNLGTALASQNHHEEAITALDLAIALEPFTPDAWEALGNSLSKLMRFQEALDAYNNQMRAIIYHSNYQEEPATEQSQHPDKLLKIDEEEVFVSFE
jgi:Leucine-rich repeat (LRR) protein